MAASAAASRAWPVTTDASPRMRSSPGCATAASHNSAARSVSSSAASTAVFISPTRSWVYRSLLARSAGLSYHLRALVCTNATASSSAFFAMPTNTPVCTAW